MHTREQLHLPSNTFNYLIVQLKEISIYQMQKYTIQLSNKSNKYNIDLGDEKKRDLINLKKSTTINDIP